MWWQFGSYVHVDLDHVRAADKVVNGKGGGQVWPVVSPPGRYVSDRQDGDHDHGDHLHDHVDEVDDSADEKFGGQVWLIAPPPGCYASDVYDDQQANYMICEILK